MAALYETLNPERRGHVIHLWLNRPLVRNAFNELMISELTRFFSTLDQDTELRAVVLGGAGEVFCAGADVEWMRKSKDRSESENLADAAAMAVMFQTIDQCPVPLLGRVQKAAFGGALGLISVCDMVVAETGTQFCFSEVRLGIVPAVISTFAKAKIGVSQARRYFLTGEVFVAEKAPPGLIHEVVPKGDLDLQITAWLKSIAEAGPNAVREIKSLLHRLRRLPENDKIDLCVRTIASVRTSPEAQAGLSAFLNKSLPPWRSEEEH